MEPSTFANSTARRGALISYRLLGTGWKRFAARWICSIALMFDWVWTFTPETTRFGLVNGVVRGRDMHPILIRSVVHAGDQLAGFEQVTPDQMDLLAALTKKQKQYWDQLPREFRFEEVADRSVPRSSLSRLLSRAKQFGTIEQKPDGTFTKLI